MKNRFLAFLKKYYILMVFGLVHPLGRQGTVLLC